MQLAATVQDLARICASNVGVASCRSTAGRWYQLGEDSRVADGTAVREHEHRQLLTTCGAAEGDGGGRVSGCMVR
ncbi:hypothetical protein LIA77_08554 [Sarocladium implicatum]|nr:hypothetical protein LIA77_08554 [Sarocladium implicatum]